MQHFAVPLDPVNVLETRNIKKTILTEVPTNKQKKQLILELHFKYVT